MFDVPLPRALGAEVSAIAFLVHDDEVVGAEIASASIEEHGSFVCKARRPTRSVIELKINTNAHGVSNAKALDAHIWIAAELCAQIFRY